MFWLTNNTSCYIVARKPLYARCTLNVCILCILPVYAYQAITIWSKLPLLLSLLMQEALHGGTSENEVCERQTMHKKEREWNKIRQWFKQPSRHWEQCRSYDRPVSISVKRQCRKKQSRQCGALRKQTIFEAVHIQLVSKRWVHWS